VGIADTLAILCGSQPVGVPWLSASQSASAGDSAPPRLWPVVSTCTATDDRVARLRNSCRVRPAPGSPVEGFIVTRIESPLAVAREMAGLPAVGGAVQGTWIETLRSSRNQSSADGMLVPAMATTKRVGCPMGLATYIAFRA
jgi:hypothetical protein